MDIYSVWIAAYFNLHAYMEHRELSYNFFGERQTLLSIDEEDDLKEYIKYYLVETETTVLGSFISQSYDWLSHNTGDVRQYATLRPK